MTRIIIRRRGMMGLAELSLQVGIVLRVGEEQGLRSLCL